jgi:hypothetical protein
MNTSAAVAAETWGELGPAMRALPNERWRAFVQHYVTGKPGKGAPVRALRAAGFKSATPLNQAREAYKLLHDDRIIAAIAEQSKKHFRAAIPEAVQAARDIIADVAHKDRARVAMALIERVDPAVTRHEIGVTHRVVDADQEALEELKAARQLGATREKLLELFGENGLDRLEVLEAAEIAKRSAAAKVIAGNAIEVAAIESEAIEILPPQDDPDPEMLGDEP